VDQKTSQRPSSLEADTLTSVLHELRQLRQDVQAIRQLLQSDRQTVENMLRRRGNGNVKYTSRTQLIFPSGCSQATKTEFYNLMKKYSFRIFLRDLITYSQTPTPGLLTRYCSERAVQRYLSTLLQHKLLRQDGPAHYSFTTDTTPLFGDTFEWFIANVLQREFAAPAVWGLQLKHCPAGGDYDVIASVEGHFTYLEVKSSPPKHIEMPEITAFVERVQHLRPALAIFLEDTHLRMKDKLALMFEAEMRRRFGEQASQTYPVQRLHHEIFTINKTIFISNTKPDVVTNLGICLRHFLARGL
jgi:hypothetical protein